MRTSRTHGATAALLALVVGALAAPALASDAPHGDAVVKAPVGVWAGPTGEADDDYGVLAIAAGRAGEQSAVYIEQLSGKCGAGNVVFYGVATREGDTVTFQAENGYCNDTGAVEYGVGAGGEEFAFSLTYTAAGTMYWGVIFGEDIDWSRACPVATGDMDKFGATTTVIRGNGQDNTLVGTEGNDIIDGRGGNDTINGLGGIDVLCGNRGKDVLRGGDGPDVLLGMDGNDTILGQRGMDFGVGAGGKDKLFGNGGNDWLVGGPKRDRITGGGGNMDTAEGNAGNDNCDAEIEISC